MSDPLLYKGQVERVLASQRVLERKPPREAIWSLSCEQPPDLAELYRACDGVVLDDGVRIFGGGELFDVTRWLVLEKGLAWSDELLVVGERRDVVIVLDLDANHVRSGGGVLEVGSDDLEAFERVASGLLDYLSYRLGIERDARLALAEPPEITARRAASAADAAALERELARPMYPGQNGLLAVLSLQLGALWARADESERALLAFARAVDARVATMGRGAQQGERRAAWRAAAHVARVEGKSDLAALCEQRATLAGSASPNSP